MSERIRHCVECPRCHTCYLIGFSPYRNGSYLVAVTAGSDEYTLYCFCDGSQQSSVCRWPEVKACRVSKRAHDRGYGSAAEILPLFRSQQSLHVPDISLCDALKSPQFRAPIRSFQMKRNF